VRFALSGRFKGAERRERAERFLSLVGLKDYFDFYPRELSGGMCQRVSLARAFAYPSKLILMDEPFKELDLKIKRELWSAFFTLCAGDGKTVIFTTHDPLEAARRADEIFILGDRPVSKAEKLINPAARADRTSANKKFAAFQERLFTLLE
jgi:NitT/TauT family transport system ATP-binding protein